MSAGGASAGAVRPSAVDPTECVAKEGTTTLPDNCTDPGDTVVSGTTGRELAVPVPADGTAVSAQAYTEDGTTLSIDASADRVGTVTVEVDHSTATGTALAASGLGECSDAGYRLIRDWNNESTRWYTPLTWRFKINSSPAGLAQADVVRFIQQALVNNISARNNCGIPDQVSATGSYVGTTNAPLNFTPSSCLASDGIDTVGFKDLGQNSLLALACVWSRAHAGPDEIVSVDIAINNRRGWYLPGRACSRQFNLEATMTHEFGHALGLDDLSAKEHPNLTMNGTSKGTCQGSEMTLGKGDLRGLEQLY